ncbi:MAG: acetylglutamate kinase [Clostridiales bacterium]|nr:acetylglutamate kinase [Clostridiales bacterium]
MKDSFKSTIERAAIICEALPYIRKYTGKTIVIKYGGNAMNDEAVTTTILQDIAALKIVGVNPILVHGGGPEINKLLGRLGIEPQFKNGMRVTDKQTMEVAQMILCGKINKNIVGELNSMGVKAIGLCGKDSQLIKAETLDAELGYVGKITEINAKLLEILAKDEFIPVIASIATDDNGNSYNVNADVAAAAIGAAMHAEKLLFLSDIDGIMANKDKAETLIDRISVSELRKMIESGAISGGMVPKANSCIDAIERGINSVFVLNGTLPHSILLELFTDSGVGTMIEKD